jgi:hypothetical protein
MLSLSESVKPLWLTLVESAALATISVAVALSIAFNLVGWYQRNREGRIKLTITDPDGNVSAKEEFSRSLLGNIDDLGGTEGEAVGVRAFWRKVRILTLTCRLPDVEGHLRSGRGATLSFSLLSVARPCKVTVTTLCSLQGAPPGISSTSSSNLLLSPTSAS